MQHVKKSTKSNTDLQNGTVQGLSAALPHGIFWPNLPFQNLTWKRPNHVIYMSSRSRIYLPFAILLLRLGSDADAAVVNCQVADCILRLVDPQVDPRSSRSHPSFQIRSLSGNVPNV